MAEEKKPWEQDFETESNATNPWDQDFEVEDTSKKKDPTFVSPKKPSQESVSPYQDSGSKSVSPQPPSVSSSEYKFEPVKQPVQTSYSVTTQEKEPYSELNKDKGSVEGAIKASAKIIQNRANNEYDRINYSIEETIPVYEQNLKSKKDLEDQLNNPNTDPSAIPFLEKEYEKIISDIKNGDAILKNGFNSLKKLDNANFIASQAEQVGKDLKLNKDTGAGGIFMRSAWNAFVPATVKGIGALTSLGGTVNAPSYSLDDDQKAELLSRAKEKYGEEKGVQLAEKFNKSLEGNQLLQTAGNFVADFGADLELEIPTKAQGSVLDGFTFDKAANIAGSGVGSMAAMLLPAGAMGKAGKAAQLATAWGSSSLQTMGGVYEEAKAAGLSDSEAAYLSLAIALPVGAVDAVSGARFFGSKRAAKELVDVAVKELSGRTVTPAILSEVADRSVKTMIKDRGIDILQEGGTGAVQQAIEEGVKAGYDKATGDNAFNVTAESAAKNIFDSAFGEAFGAGFVNTISGSKDLILKKGKITESAYDQAVKVGKDAASREYFRKMLETSVKNGVITQDEADNVKKNINAIIEADKLIPSSIKKVEKRVAAVELLREKNSLEAQIEGKDKSLTVRQQERIKAIDSELQAIASGRTSVTMKRRKMESEKPAEVTKEPVVETIVEPEEITALRKAQELVPLTPEEQAKLDEYDSKNKPRVPSEVGGGEASIQAESIKKEGEGTIEAGGVVQAQEKVQPVKDGNKLFSEPDERISVITDNYKKSKGISYSAGEKITEIDQDRAKKIADAYEDMKHDPNNPEVKRAYEAMASETIDQHKLLSDNGYKFEIYEGEGEPYKNSQEMLKDLRDNKHLFILSTEKEFGQQKITDQQRSENPLLRDSGIKDVNGKPLLVNDVFRGVHDAIGHGERGNSFGAKGEENAWDVHSRMYSPEARRAMTTETRGQNSWVNFGKHLRNEDGSIKKVSAKDKPFADQKIGLLPEWVSEPYEKQVVSENKSRDQFIADKKQQLRDDEGADYAPSMEPFYDKYFGSQFDFLYGENISEEESAVREKILGEVDRVKSALSSIAPGVKIISHGTTDSFRQALKDAGSTDEEVQQKKLGGGFYDSNTNEIHLNLPEVRSNTLFHEGVHPILNAIEAIDENLIDKLFNQVVEVEKRAGVEGKYSKEFAGRYDEAQQKMEAITEFIADVADGTIEINETNFDKIKKLFIDLMDAIGIDVSGVIKTVSDLKELADKIKTGFDTGGVIKVGEFKSKTKEMQAQKPVKGDLVANSPKFKFMTEDGEGNYVFYHYSSSDLSKKGIDPNKTGKNIITSKSEKLLAPASFYYTEPNIQEPGTGEYAHVVRVPKDKVYPYNEDPLNFAEEAERRFREKYPNQAFDANKELAWVSVVAAENGYDVTVANWDGLAGFKQTLRAQSPVKLKPEIWKKPKPGYYNAFDVNDDLEFKSNRRKPLRQQPDQEITPEELKFASDLLKNRFAGNEKTFAKALLATDKGKDLIARGVLSAIAKKTGTAPTMSNKSRVEAVNKRLIESENIPEELRTKIQSEGTVSEVFSNDEAKQIADGYIKELGVDEAVKLADEGYLKGSVKVFVYGAAIDNITQQINEAKTQEEKDALADKGADIAASLQADAEQYGRFIQAIGSYYKQSPLIIAKREVNRLEKASQDAFNRMVNKKDKVEKTNQGLNYVRKKNVDPEAIKKIKTPRNEKEKVSELNKLRDLWSSLKAKGARQLSDYSDEQIDVLHRMAVIFYADGKQSFASLYKALKEETGISKSDFNELINSKLPADISPDGMSIVDLANEVNKPLVERVSKEKVEKSDIEKILDSGNRKKAGKSQNVPQKLYAIYGDLNKENRKKMYEDIKNNPDKGEDQLLAEWSSVLNEQQQQAIIDKHFPEKPTENKEKRKAEHEKIIDAYNSGIVNNKGGDKFKELFFDKFGLPKTNTEEMLNYIDQISQKLAKAPEGSIMWRETYEDLLDYIADNTYKNAIASGMDKLSAMWYANILSSPATHLRNLQYNAAQALVLNPLMIFEKALLKGDLGQLANVNKGMIEGLKKGAIETGRVFRTGRGTRFDGIMERSLADRKLKLWSPVGRALRGSDIFFSDTAYQLKLREFARAMVKEEHPGWNNDEVNAKVNDLMGQTKERKEFASKQAEQELNAFYGENKPKDYETIKKIREFEIIEQTMPDNLKNKLEESKNWAKKSLLTNRPTGLFGVVSDLVGTLNKKLYVTRFIIPFINVPLNVAQAMIERSPFGLIKAATTNTLHSMSDKFEYLNPDQKRELTLKAINYTVGMALLAMINGDDDDDELVITGNNTGEYMDDQGIVHAGGLEPMSVYVDGKKVMSYKTSPFASLLLPAGLMRDAKLYGETKNTTDAISNAFINYIMFINDASAMQGLQGFFGAVADKKLDRAESVRKWFGKQANALTPYSGAVKFITNTVNAAQGEADTRPIELYEYVVKDLPFVQGLVGVSTRRDHFGEPVKEKFDIPLVPVGHRGLLKEISDISPYYKLMNEKDYLQYLKFPTKRTFMVGGKEVEISKKELDQLNTRRGEIVRKALNSKNVFKSRLKEDSARRDMTTIEYLKTLDNELFKERMDQLFDEAGNIARIEKFGEQYGVTKSNLKDHLLELEKARSPKSKKDKSVPAKARVNRKTLNDFKEKNIEIVIESL